MALQNVVVDIEDANATLIGISPQLTKYTRQVAKKHHLTFSVLGDPGNQVAAKFGLVYTFPDDLRELYKQFGTDFKRFYGDDTWQVPMPGRFILDSQGTIIHSDVHPDYTKRPEPADIVSILKSI